MLEGELKKISLGKLVLVLFILNTIIKLAFININAAQYTDGIIQLTLFENPNTLWPPIYTIVVKALTFLTRNEILSGRIVSLISSGLVLIPLMMLSFRLFGKQAAVLSAIIYIISPIPTRWSVRVMTDSLFTLFFFMAAFLFINSVILSRRDGTETLSKKGEGLRDALGSVVFAVLATLTHYRGIVLLPLNIINLFFLITTTKRSKKKVDKVIIFIATSVVLWLLVPGWIALRGFGHVEQLSERFGIGAWCTALNYLNLYESFLLLSPYFFTFAVFFFLLFGLFRRGQLAQNVHDSEHLVEDGNRYGERVSLIVFVYLTIAVVLMQSMFQSFQSRYLLPLVPFVALYSGKGVAQWEKGMAKHKTLVRFVLILSFIYTYGFTLAVMSLQRGAFGDIRESALYIRSLETDAPVYSNETYREGLDCQKMRYWSDKDVRPISELPAEGKGNGEAFIVLHSAYYGGMTNLYALEREIKKRCEKVEVVRRFESTLVPLLPDIMEVPLTHQNPKAFVFRYMPQNFQTVIYRVEFEIEK